MRHGYGEFSWPKGRKYIGNWKHDKKHGEGATIDKDGNKQEGLWENGKKLD